MNVQAIVDRILDFGLDETDADNELEARVLGDVNEVYNLLQNLISTVAFADYGQTETVAVTNGVGTVTDQLRAMSVVDVTGNRMLKKTDFLTLEEEDLQMTTTGAPTQYYITGGTTINTYPINSTSIRFSFYPQPNVLLLADAESVIRAPVHLHDVLVQGGNYLTSLREQGFHDRLDRGEKLRNWMNTNGFVSGYLMNRNRKTRRVKYYD